MTTSDHDSPRCTAFLAASLDGYIAGPGDDLAFLERAELEGEDYGYAELMRQADVMVLGRRTYEVALGFEAWPYVGKRCVVLSRTPRAPRHDEEIVSATPEALVARLGSEGARHLYVDGGGLVRSFLRAGLLHELVLSVVPVVLGAGVRLWCEGGPEVPLRLESTRAWSSGLVQLRYAVEQAGPREVPPR